MCCLLDATHIIPRPLRLVELASAPPVAVTVRVASTPVRVTKLVHPSDASGEAALEGAEEKDDARLTDTGELACWVVVIAIPASVDVGSVALKVVVMLTPSPGVGKGIGPSRVWPSVCVIDTAPAATSDGIEATGIGRASGVDMRMVLPSANVWVTTMVVMLVSKICGREEMLELIAVGAVDDETTGSPGAVVAVCAEASIVVVIVTC